MIRVRVASAPLKEALEYFRKLLPNADAVALEFADRFLYVWVQEDLQNGVVRINTDVRLSEKDWAKMFVSTEGLIRAIEPAKPSGDIEFELDSSIAACLTRFETKAGAICAVATAVRFSDTVNELRLRHQLGLPDPSTRERT